MISTHVDNRNPTAHRNPLVEFTVAVTIDAPRATVFSYLANLEHNPDWNWAIFTTRPLQAGPGGRGSRFHQTSKSADSATLEITMLMPDRLLEVSSGPAKPPPGTGTNSPIPQPAVPS